MADSPMLSLIRTWAAVAWADGKIADAEGEALKRLIDGAELTAADREAANAMLAAPVDLADGGLDGLSPDSRRGIYKAACRMAAVDREVAASERALLVRLRDALGITVDDAREIEATIPGVTAS
ncbi:MAG: DUF533 domain-containing protein [Myxococcales bacterium]|nr:DUF533 domain-containing protein [Myxococcales bacterium]MBK7196295.1 DUF533 domain-containing protein [Myxococcales bacterium]MBP6849321.1 DUF533 domain-containing protein [Kofleriaceae bacterium]